MEVALLLDKLSTRHCSVSRENSNSKILYLNWPQNICYETASLTKWKVALNKVNKNQLAICVHLYIFMFSTFLMMLSISTLMKMGKIYYLWTPNCGDSQLWACSTLTGGQKVWALFWLSQSCWWQVWLQIENSDQGVVN